MLITILYVCNHKGPTPNELNLRMIDCLKKKKKFRGRLVSKKYSIRIRIGNGIWWGRGEKVMPLLVAALS